MSTDTLRHLFSNGAELWFTMCKWCSATSPPHAERDDLQVLAAARRAGWLIERGVDGRHVVVCPRCVHTRALTPAGKGGAA